MIFFYGIWACTSDHFTLLAWCRSSHITLYMITVTLIKCREIVVSIYSLITSADSLSSVPASSFGDLVVSMLASGTQDCRFKPGRSRLIFGVKKSTACLPSEGEVKPSVPCCRFAGCKRTLWFTWESESQAKLTGHFSLVILSFTNRGLSCRLTWSASGDDGRN
jgi:hypothetical protein